MAGLNPGGGSMPGGIDAPVPGGTNRLSGNGAPDNGLPGPGEPGADGPLGAPPADGPPGTPPADGLLGVLPDDGSGAPAVEPPTDRGLTAGESGSPADELPGDEGETPGWPPTLPGNPADPPNDGPREPRLAGPTGVPGRRATNAERRVAESTPDSQAARDTLTNAMSVRSCSGQDATACGSPDRRVSSILRSRHSVRDGTANCL